MREAREVKNSTAAGRHGPQIIVAHDAATSTTAADTPPPASPRTPTKQTHPTFRNDENEDTYLVGNVAKSEAEQPEKHGEDVSRVTEEQGQAVDVEADTWDKVRDKERDDEVLQGFLARHAAEEAYPPLGGKRSEHMYHRRGCDTDGGDEGLAGAENAAAGSEWGLKVLW